jgi:hypothetical protein
MLGLQSLSFFSTLPSLNESLGRVGPIANPDLNLLFHLRPFLTLSISFKEGVVKVQLTAQEYEPLTSVRRIPGMRAGEDNPEPLGLQELSADALKQWRCGRPYKFPTGAGVHRSSLSSLIDSHVGIGSETSPSHPPSYVSDASPS